MFNKILSTIVFTWNAILTGCTMHGHGRAALEHFDGMCEEGVQPNDVTFVRLLSACSHAGLVDEGMRCYASMMADYRISAKLEHYICMVYLFGCAGDLEGISGFFSFHTRLVLPQLIPEGWGPCHQYQS